MELLSEVTINAVLHRVSDAWQTLNYLWEPKIASYTPTKFGIPKLYGGYVRPKWGNRSFSPDLFAGSDWPPPSALIVKDMLTESDEASAITVFEGTLHLDNFNEFEVSYNSYGAVFTTTATDEVYNDTLVNIFAIACGVTKLNLTLDSSAARVVSPAVVYTASGEKMLIDNLSDMAAFFSHAFYIEDGTLYLVDLLLNNGITALDEFGYFRGSEHKAPPPYSLFKAGNYHQDGSYRYGEELEISPVCHNVQANIETALTNIKSLVELFQYRIRVIPESDKLPVIGQLIIVVNESMQEATISYIKVTDISPDITNSEILISGIGVSV